MSGSAFRPPVVTQIRMLDGQLASVCPYLLSLVGRSTEIELATDLKHPAAYHPPPQRPALASWTGICPLQPASTLLLGAPAPVGCGVGASQDLSSSCHRLFPGPAASAYTCRQRSRASA